MDVRPERTVKLINELTSDWISEAETIEEDEYEEPFVLRVGGALIWDEAANNIGKVLSQAKARSHELADDRLERTATDIVTLYM